MHVDVGTRELADGVGEVGDRRCATVQANHARHSPTADLARVPPHELRGHQPGHDPGLHRTLQILGPQTDADDLQLDRLPVEPVVPGKLTSRSDRFDIGRREGGHRNSVANSPAELLSSRCPDEYLVDGVRPRYAADKDPWTTDVDAEPSFGVADECEVGGLALDVEGSGWRDDEARGGGNHRQRSDAIGDLLGSGFVVHLHPCVPGARFLAEPLEGCRGAARSGE